MIAVIIPIAIFVFLGGNAVYDKIAARIMVQSADDIEKSRFAAAGMPEDRNEFALAKGHSDAFQRANFGIAGNVIFNDIYKL